MKKFILLTLAFTMYMVSSLNSTVTNQYWVPSIYKGEGEFEHPKIQEALLDPTQLECMAKNIYFEAAIESTAGKLAVAQVTLNRVNSTRFPNKILQKIGDKTILEVIVERIKKIENINRIILVTGSNKNNNELVNKAEELNLDVFCGDEENILDRFYHAANEFHSENIIRITGDCPLIDFKLISKGLKIYHSEFINILTNTKKRSFPHGFDFEIFSKKSLDMAWRDVVKNGKIKKGEFINPVQYMMNSGKFKIYNLENAFDQSKIRITIDYPEDLIVISKIYKELFNKNEDFASEEIIKFLDLHPELVKINEKFEYM